MGQVQIASPCGLGGSAGGRLGSVCLLRLLRVSPGATGVITLESKFTDVYCRCSFFDDLTVNTVVRPTSRFARTDGKKLLRIVLSL